jgi:hypothetical protein
MRKVRDDNRETDVNSDAIFRQMVESAFDFLDRSQSELEKSPKYSIIHFATAIELFLKSRLLREHWTLVVAVSGDAERASFKEGRAKTVTPDQAAKRLDQISGVAVPQPALASFKSIAAHRNRMIHFFHEAGSSEAEQEVRAEISREQLNAWFHLLQLINSWRPHFDQFQNELDRIERGMRRVRDFVSVAFEALRPTIEGDQANGAVYVPCNSCGYDAAKLSPPDSIIQVATCLVCGLQDNLVTMPCPTEDCEALLKLTGWNTGEDPCERCGQKIDQSQLVDFLDTEFVDFGGYSVEKNCGICTTASSVVLHHGVYICTNCLAHDTEIANCEWCNELQLGYDLQDSYYKGCEFCEGKMGWDADD